MAEDVGIVQYDRSGNRQEFFGKKVIRVPTTDGGTKDFVGAALTEKTVELDFSGGDMTIEPGAGELYSMVKIPVPAGLMPEHIQKGVTIAGIAGAMATGGGTNIVCASGTFKNPTVGDFSISHNLGVTPDIVIIYTTEFTAVNSADVLRFFVGFSTAFSQAIDGTLISFNLRNRYATVSGGYKVYRETVVDASDSLIFNVYVDSAQAGLAGTVYGANEESFILNNASGQQGYVDPALEYKWFAIGGLT